MTDRVPRLVEQARLGDADAFEQLVRQHIGVAFAVARAIVPTRADAEDVVQDSLIRAWDRLDQCRDPSRFKAWLVAIVRSVALNHRSRERRFAAVPLDAAPVPTDPSTEAGSRLARREARERLDRVVNELSEAQRAVLLLHDLEGYSHGEIASLLEISNAMSRRYLSDAKRLLRARFAPDEEDAT